MSYIGKTPTAVPLTSSDITDNIITSAKIVDGAIATADIADGAVTSAKTTGVGGANTPSFFAVSTSSEDGNNVPDNTLTKMTFSTEVYDTNSNYASSRFTPTTAGKFFIFTKAMADNVVANAQTKLEFYKNGSQMDDQYRMRVRTGGSPIGDIEQTLILSAIIDMNGSGDYIEVYAAHNNGGNTGGLQDKFFGAYKLIGV